MIALYRPGDSILHRMPAGAKIIAFGAIAIAMSMLGATANDARSKSNARMARAEVEALVTERVRRSIEADHGEMNIEPLVAEVAERRISPRAASEIVLNRLGKSTSRRCER